MGKPLLEELSDLFAAANATPYNMRSDASKKACADLTAFCWRFLAPYAGGKPAWFSEPHYPDFFNVSEQEYAARIYELMWFANLAFIASENPALLDEAARTLEAEARSGLVPTRSNLVLRGAVEYRRRNFPLAKHFISRAHHELILDSVVSPFFAYSRSSCLFDEPYRPPAKPESLAHSKPWLLIAADANYVVKFLPNYVDTVVEHGGAHIGGLHVRLISTTDPEDRTSEALSVIESARGLLGDRVEVSRTAAPAVRDTRSWFAAERFLFARELLREKGRLIITDTDYGLRENPGEFVEWASTYDVCVLLARDEEFKAFFPWIKVQAGTVVVSDTAAGRNFLDDFATYFHNSFVGAGWNWGIDQNALSNAADNLAGRAAVGNINDVRQPFYIPRDLKRS